MQRVQSQRGSHGCSRAAAVLEECRDARLRAQPLRNEILVVPR